MPRRRQRAGPVASSSRSASASPELAISQQDFSDLKEVVHGVLARLEVLERIFVFVDLEQINDVLSKYQTQVPPVDKAGIDGVLAGFQWEALPMNRLHLDHCTSIPEETGENVDKTSEKQFLKEAPSGSNRSLQELSKAIADELRMSSQSQRMSSGRCGADASLGPESPRDLKQCIWEAPAQSVLDEDEQKSTCSTWDLCSTRDGLDMEGDVDPEIFSRFMRQALRPQWEMRIQEGQSAQSTGGSASDDHLAKQSGGADNAPVSITETGGAPT